MFLWGKTLKSNEIRDFVLRRGLDNRKRNTREQKSPKVREGRALRRSELLRQKASRETIPSHLTARSSYIVPVSEENTVAYGTECRSPHSNLGNHMPEKVM